MFDLSSIIELLSDGAQMSLVSLLVAVGLMKLRLIKKLGLNFMQTTLATGVILDLIARNGQTILSIAPIVLAGILATRVWTHR